MADQPGPDLRRLAGLCFDRAAHGWYLALGIEAVSAVVSTAVAVLALSGAASAVGMLASIALLLLAYGFRLRAESLHDVALTMNRQGALSTGLGWTVDRFQLDEWRRLAGAKTVAAAAKMPLEPDYYATSEPVGPRRMAEMQLESAFYTRHLWIALRDLMGVGLIGVVLAALAAVYLTLALPADAGFSVVVAQVLASVVLFTIGVDVVGWLIKLTRQAGALQDVIRDLDRLLEKSAVRQEPVLRVVIEYSCEMVGSIPIHRRFLDWKHDDIQSLWGERAGKTV
jgi:hypothetical protein